MLDNNLSELWGLIDEMDITPAMEPNSNMLLSDLDLQDDLFPAHEGNVRVPCPDHLDVSRCEHMRTNSQTEGAVKDDDDNNDDVFYSLAKMQRTWKSIGMSLMSYHLSRQHQLQVQNHPIQNLTWSAPLNHIQVPHHWLHVLQNLYNLFHLPSLL